MFLEVLLTLGVILTAIWAAISDYRVTKLEGEVQKLKSIEVIPATLEVTNNHYSAWEDHGS
jgi:heme/copper-type cytochrome/quinol oxidase subunit 2